MQLHDDFSRQGYIRPVSALFECIKNSGYSGEQAYMLLSAVPIEGRVSGVVDIPNACATVAIPTVIFNKPILPI